MLVLALVTLTLLVLVVLVRDVVSEVKEWQVRRAERRHIQWVHVWEAWHREQDAEAALQASFDEAPAEDFYQEPEPFFEPMDMSYDYIWEEWDECPCCEEDDYLTEFYALQEALYQEKLDFAYNTRISELESTIMMEVKNRQYGRTRKVRRSKKNDLIVEFAVPCAWSNGKNSAKGGLDDLSEGAAKFEGNTVSVATTENSPIEKARKKARRSRNRTQVRHALKQLALEL